MKRGLMIGITSVALLAATSHAAVVETFNYSTGVLGTAASTGTGLTGNWGSFASSGTISGSATGTISSGSLSAPTDYLASPSNNKLTHSGTAGSVTASMVELGSGNSIDFNSNNTYYISFLERHTAIAFAFNLQSHLQLRTDSNGTIAELGFFGGNLRISGDGTSTLAGMSNDVDRLYVFKIEASSSGQDVIRASAWTSADTIGSEPVTWALNHTAATGISGAATFFNASLGANAGAGVTHTTQMDEIRFGDSFLEVTGVPEPASLVLMGIGGLTMLARRRAA